MSNNNRNQFEDAAELLKNASHTVAFTGAGVSVESGIPPFRGENGLWNKYDPIFLDIGYFHQQPKATWKIIKEIFYDFFGKAVPNAAHYSLAKLEHAGYLQSIITQNIDSLHQEAGSNVVYEYHGNCRDLVCTGCSSIYPANENIFNDLPPLCEKCDQVLKPDFVFFGEAIPEPARSKSMEEAQKADLFIIIGTTGEITPASYIPYEAKRNNCFIIEINTEPSAFTESIIDVFLQGKATVMMERLAALMIPTI